MPYVGTGYSSPMFPAPTGPAMNAETQLRAMGSVGTLFSIVSTLANSTGAANWRLWRRATSGLPEDRVEVLSHLALDIWNKPNPFMTRQEFIESVQQHVDLTGEGWMVVGRNPAMRSIPLELWPVRPDRIFPVPSPTDYLSGYVYAAPDGSRIPLERDEVIQLRMPNPMDPYRGMGPVQSILTDLDSTRYSAEWNRNFFRNSAQPGGIIEAPEEMGQTQWRIFTERWRESHQGVNNAHRVAVLENGMKWVDRQFSQRDMQFAELNTLSREIIREAFGVHGHKLGMSESVNRANADAADVTYARDKIVPRLERFKQALNNDYLPLFGATALGLEFDYDNPVPADDELSAKLLTARANAAVTLVGAGFSAPDVLTVCELPDMEYSKPEPKPAPVIAPPAPAALPADKPKAISNVITNADEELSPTQRQWLDVLDALLAEWPAITAAQRTELHAQIRAAIDHGELGHLGTLTVDTTAAAALIEKHLKQMASDAGAEVVAEAALQGVTAIEAQMPPVGTIAALAAVTAALLGAGYALAAGREALRIQQPTSKGEDVADSVDTFLAAMPDATPRAEFGAALTGIQNDARLATFIAGPIASLYASERDDKHTCKECKQVNGKFLGTTDDGTIMAEVDKSYPLGALGGYIHCLGRARCRGSIVGTWRKGTGE